MRSERFNTRLRRQRYGIAGLATLLVAALLIVIPNVAFAAKSISYTFVFEHTDGTTTEVSGVATDNNTFIADAGGTDKDDPTGMTVHVSCSDKFTGGWGDKEGPDPTADSEWRIQSYTIDKDGKLCSGGDPVPPKRPAIDIEKATNGEDADDPTGPEIPVGDTVTWTYVVTNTGETPLRDVVVVDYVPTVGSSDSTEIDCPKTELAIGEQMTCTMTGVAELGQYENEAKVTAIGTTGVSTSAFTGKKQFTFIFEHTDGTTTRIDGSSDKNEAFLPNAGGSSVDNPTGMTVHVSCSDKFPGGWGAKDGPQQGVDTEWRIAAFYIREVKNGEIKKSCGSPIPNEVMVMDQDPSHYIGVPGDPGIDIEKATNGQDADNAPGPRILEGDTVTWTYVVTNTGDVDLFGIVVDDDIEGFIGTISFLAAGDSATLEHEGIARAGQYANEGCAVGTTADQEEVEDCDPSHYNGDDPGIDIEKATNGEDADVGPGPRILEGNRVTWTYVVTNTGDVDLFDIDVTDDVEGYIGTIGFLEPGDSATLEHIGTATVGQYENEGCAVGTTSDQREVSDCDPSHYHGKDPYDVPRRAKIDLEKATNGVDADDPTGPRIPVGNDVVWTYTITNIGDVDLWAIYLYDEEEGRVTCPDRNLSPGETVVCTLRGTASAGQYGNEAWVDSWDDTGARISDSDWSHYYGVEDVYDDYSNDDAGDAGITLEKRIEGADADTKPGVAVTAGSSIEVTYVITNTTGSTLYGVYLYDEAYGAIDCPKGRLAAGESMTCTITVIAKPGTNGDEAWVDAWTDERFSASDFGYYTGS